MSDLTPVDRDALDALDEAAFYTDSKDPAKLGWPVTLPVELALKIAPPDEIRKEYGYSPEEWAALKADPGFLRDLAAACEMARKEGMTFKLKAQLQAEELLKTSWRLIHAPTDEVSPAVKADLIKSTARWAGYDSKEAVAGPGGTPLQINIQFNNENVAEGLGG